MSLSRCVDTWVQPVGAKHTVVHGGEHHGQLEEDSVGGDWEHVVLLLHLLDFVFLVLWVLGVLGKWLTSRWLGIILCDLLLLSSDSSLCLIGIITGVTESTHHEETEQSDCDTEADLSSGIRTASKLWVAVFIG